MSPLGLSFDLFGTVFDWRAGVARLSALHLAAIGRADVNPHDFADAWRLRYLPALARTVHDGRGFVILDKLHREMLVDLLGSLGIDPVALDPNLLDEWTRAWHQLDPWPDIVAALIRLRRRHPVVSLSNGHVALVVALSRRSGLVWDAVVGAEFSQAYKPAPATYLDAAAALGIAPGELCHVASHHSDLAAARSQGLLTAYVDRPLEYGGAPAPDRDAAQDWDYSGKDLDEIADLLGC